MNLNWKVLVETLLGLTVATVIAFSFTWFAGENPVHVLQVLFMSAFGTNYDLGFTLFYATPLILTGLAVAIAGQAGLFNIGAEGQMTLGVVATAVVGATVILPFPWAAPFALLVGLLVAGLWGAIPGWMKVARGSHEVITTIMLNFVAAGIASFVAVQVIPNPGSMNPETPPIGEAYFLQNRDPLAALFPDTPLSCAFLVAVGLAILLWVFLYKTVWGYELRAIGQNEKAALTAGINVRRLKIFAMFLSGLCTGFVAHAEVLGNSGQFKLGFSPSFGFTGIAVALLARNSPIGVIFTGLLFGALHKGATGIEFETEHITRDFSFLLQGIIILFISARALWAYVLSRNILNLNTLSFKNKTGIT